VPVVKSSPKKPSTRQAKAEMTRTRMLSAAYDLLCEKGFRATTMEAIADRAGVAVQTLYFTFHTKDALLQAVHDWTVLGDDPTPPPLQPWHVAAMAAPDGRRGLELLVAGLVTIEARVAPMLPVFHAVSADPAGAVFRHGEALRRTGFEEMVAALAQKTPLRRGMTRRRAADLFFVLAGPESYRSFVIEAGWTERQWISWVSTTLIRDLFGEET
jgi:AcrR family transcriptional regulator